MNQCPICKEPMVAFELEGIEIDRCVDCRGTWLDNGELELIAQLAGLDQDPLVLALDGAGTGVESKRHCPRCKAKLREIEIRGSKKPVHIDQCPRGDGFWFDQGEIKAVIDSFSTDDGGAVARFFADLLHDEVTPPNKGDS